MCVTFRNTIYFHLHPARGLARPVCTLIASALAALAPDTVARCTRPGTVRLPATTWTVSLAPGTVSQEILSPGNSVARFYQSDSISYSVARVKVMMNVESRRTASFIDASDEEIGR